VRVDIPTLDDYLTSDVALEEPQIGSADPHFPISNNCTDDELHFGIPRGSGDFDDEGDKPDAIPTTRRPRRVATELERFDLGSSDVDSHDNPDGHNADADEEEATSQSDDGSMQNAEGSGFGRLGLGTRDVEAYEGKDGDNPGEEE
jgi:hypothetical protein